MISDASWQELCTGLVRSDDRAFERIFFLIRDDLVRYVRSIVNDDSTSHDLVQDVFVSLWNLRASLDPDRPLRSYIFRMARNRAFRHLRDERIHARREAVLASDPRPGSGQPDDGYDAEMLRSKLMLWMDELPMRQREALTLSRMHGLSHLEIAAVMAISPRTVNNHIMRALETLRERLQAYNAVAQPDGS
jgi:RNA polymerase sigma-70 factor (ECF subfamily)